MYKKISRSRNIQSTTQTQQHTGGATVTHVVRNSSGLRYLNTVIPRLTKIIRSGITFVNRNVISPQVSIENRLIRSGCCPPLFKDKFYKIVKTLCTYFQFNSIKCVIYFQYNSVKIVSFSFYFPFSFIQLGSCSSQPLVSFCPFYSVLFTVL